MIGSTRLDFNFLTFQTPGFWSHSCRMDVNFPMGRSFFFSHFFTPGSVSQLSCSVSGPGRRLNICGPEAPWKSGGEIRVTYATYEIAWAVLQTPVLDIDMGFYGFYFPGFILGIRKMSDDGNVIVNHHSLAFWWLCENQVPSNRMGAKICEFGSLDLCLFNVISVTSTYFFIPSIGTSDFRMAQFPPVVWGLTLW